MPFAMFSPPEIFFNHPTSPNRWEPGRLSLSFPEDCCVQEVGKPSKRYQSTGRLDPDAPRIRYGAPAQLLIVHSVASLGVDLTSGKKPSALKMAKLAMNSQFREQMKMVAEEMKKADVDFSSPEVMNEIMALKKAAETPK
ncbi:hypothetical protein H0H81_003585 [Sphagnurus paluster]|uniref:Uncharacterized protein n=1 Tax=Sphagnurus paluster TaxID=117069 RepID=A0A9P7KET2_9AGAR|nr:hypothetical protein H0H81_003585 [Sphagnurus paluster]